MSNPIFRRESNYRGFHFRGYLNFPPGESPSPVIRIRRYANQFQELKNGHFSVTKDRAEQWVFQRLASMHRAYRRYLPDRMDLDQVATLLPVFPKSCAFEGPDNLERRQ